MATNGGGRVSYFTPSAAAELQLGKDCVRGVRRVAGCQETGGGAAEGNAGIEKGG
ncbi:MAG TPA: hypothetical protein VLC55_04355 [Burkholderiales bacterium]|nr:hypothetical protein [Burkholderiales bacterium]